MVFEFWIGFNNIDSFGASCFDHFQIFYGFHAEVGDTPLLTPSELPCTTLFQIKFCQFETIFGR